MYVGMPASWLVNHMCVSWRTVNTLVVDCDFRHSGQELNPHRRGRGVQQSSLLTKMGATKQGSPTRKPRSLASCRLLLQRDSTAVAWWLHKFQINLESECSMIFRRESSARDTSPQDNLRHSTRWTGGEKWISLKSFALETHQFRHFNIQKPQKSACSSL